jgi:hypothetical protein
MNRSGGKRFDTIDVWLMEGHHAPRPQMAHQSPKRRYGICVIHQNQSPNDGIKRLSECGLNRITFLKRHIV